MVQYSIVYNLDTEFQYTHPYWVLAQPDDSVTTRNYKHFFKVNRYYFRSCATKSRLQDLYSRYQRGLISFEACTLKELRGFCSARDVPFTHNARKDTLVATLELADEHATFDRFLDLPPELRNRIYAMHINTFRTLDMPTIPPVAQASRQLRNETLLLFYQVCTIRIQMASHHHLVELVPIRLLPTKQEEVPSTTTRKLFTRLPKQYLGHIRNFELEGMFATPTHWSFVTWNVQLGHPQHGVVMLAKGQGYRWHESPHYYQLWRDKYEARIKREFERVMERDGPEKLRSGDLNLLREMFLPMDEK